MILFTGGRQREFAGSLSASFCVEIFVHQAGEPIEFIELGGAQSFGCHALDVVRCGGNDGAELSAARRQLDHALAAMVGGRSTLNYSVALHAAQGDRHGRLLDADQLRQLGLRCLVQVHQPRNDRISAGQNAVLRRTLSKTPNNAASKSIHSKAQDTLAALRQRGIVRQRERFLV